MLTFDVVYSNHAGVMDRQTVVAETLEMAQPQFASLMMTMIMSAGGMQSGDKIEVIEIEESFLD